MTFLLFSVSSCPKATGVPSPTISMVQRTALRLSVNFLYKQVTIIRLRSRQNSGLFTFWLGSVLKRSNQVAFNLSDLLFWAEYYRTAQDIGLLTIAVGQRRPVWMTQTCTVQRQYLSQTSREVELKIDHYVLRLQLWPLELLGLDALIRETYSSWPWPLLSKESALVFQDHFTSEDDKLKAR